MNFNHLFSLIIIIPLLINIGYDIWYTVYVLLWDTVYIWNVTQWDISGIWYMRHFRYFRMLNMIWYIRHDNIWYVWDSFKMWQKFYSTRDEIWYNMTSDASIKDFEKCLRYCYIMMIYEDVWQINIFYIIYDVIKDNKWNILHDMSYIYLWIIDDVLYMMM